VRGDGNCFYRSCLFGYLEGLLTKHIEGSLKEIADIERKRMLKTITDSKEELIQFGYSEIAIESFYDVTLDVLENLFNYSLEQLLESFQESGLSDYYTWYMRLLTSLNMKKNVEKYLPFIDDVDINSYCLREVEPMGKEVEMMMVMSLTEYLGIKLKVEYLDGKYEDDKKLPCVVFNVDETKKEENEFDVYLLYRPGHYDILYL
jgi:ubiquitin thioesterase protein OTUB1